MKCIVNSNVDYNLTIFLHILHAIIFLHLQWREFLSITSWCSARFKLGFCYLSLRILMVLLMYRQLIKQTIHGFLLLFCSRGDFPLKWKCNRSSDLVAIKNKYLCVLHFKLLNCPQICALFLTRHGVLHLLVFLVLAFHSSSMKINHHSETCTDWSQAPKKGTTKNLNISMLQGYCQTDSLSKGNWPCWVQLWPYFRARSTPSLSFWFFS